MFRLQKQADFEFIDFFQKNVCVDDFYKQHFRKWKWKWKILENENEKENKKF